MLNKIMKWWNTPITWGASFKVMLVSVALCVPYYAYLWYAWFGGRSKIEAAKKTMFKPKLWDERKEEN